MKRSRSAYLVLLLAFLLPFRTSSRAGAPQPTETPGPAPTLSAAAAYPVPETLRLLVGGEERELPLEDYLIGVLAGEMPASFAFEALKAQAVAARTFALYCGQSGRHPDGAVCSEPSHCQAWLDEERMRGIWGDRYDEYRARLAAAVAETAGCVLCYEGRPVFAAFHSSSAGATEDCGAIWSPRPYLVSVSSPESAETVPNYVSRLLCEPLDLRDVLLSAKPEADFTGPPESWLGPVERDASGRVATATLGGAVFSGTQLRSLFALRSTAFTLTFEDGRFRFTVTGSGHGVGMSQYGANVMAQNGADWREILAHYYPGAVLASG